MTDVRKEDSAQVDSLSKSFKSYYNDGDLRNIIGGGVLGYKSAVRQKAIEQQKEREQVRKAKGQWFSYLNTIKYLLNVSIANCFYVIFLIF